MHANNPHKNRIQVWHWGDHADIYMRPEHAPRWILNRGMLWSPCDVAGCKRHIEKREWYVRHPDLGIVCRDCAGTFGAFRPDETVETLKAKIIRKPKPCLSPVQPPCGEPCPEFESIEDCPFQSCPMKAL